MLLYVDRVRFDGVDIQRGIPAICFSTAAKMREREKSEYALGGFGTGEVLDPFVPPVISNDDHHIPDEETVEGFNLKISDLFSKFEDLKETLEEKIDTACTKFPDDSSILEWRQKLKFMFRVADPERVSDMHPVTHDDEAVNPEKFHQENFENLGNDYISLGLDSQWWDLTQTREEINKSFELFTSKKKKF
ncbi:hypothetical protein L2E82_14695 [Cichorium intybus]|uniref:Uncharacterized protein n=1 Tax=Cichorium intybus TaxID=13427 RepID=A0ACB9F0D3_CICIN|nr:hypothetical protein L2E82_14695 [Cichorium intybus]